MIHRPAGLPVKTLTGDHLWSSLVDPITEENRAVAESYRDHADAQLSVIKLCSTFCPSLRKVL